MINSLLGLGKKSEASNIAVKEKPAQQLQVNQKKIAKASSANLSVVIAGKTFA